jgi:cytochrome b involved in lipid metabolism
MKKFTLIIIFIFLAVFVFAFLAQVKKPPNYDIKAPDLSNVAPLENSTTVDTTVTQTSGIKEFTLQDVAQHASPSDCYLSINGGVYDVSSYISYHPGGRRMITSRCGTEVTNIFARIHSNRAWDILASFKIGKLASTSPASTKQATVEYDLNAIEQGLKASNPNAEVVNVKPKNDFYIAKVTYQNKLYEVHISKGGKIIQEEVANDEFNWSLWDTDSDDQ